MIERAKAGDYALKLASVGAKALDELQIPSLFDCSLLMRLSGDSRELAQAINVKQSRNFSLSLFPHWQGRNKLRFAFGSEDQLSFPSVMFSSLNLHETQAPEIGYGPAGRCLIQRQMFP